MKRAIVSLNVGSSSIKFGIFTIEPGTLRRRVYGKIENIGMAPHLNVFGDADKPLLEKTWAGSAAMDHQFLLGELIEYAAAYLTEVHIAAIGHRVAHGGSQFRHPCLVDDAVSLALDGLVPLAPLHQPHNLAGIRTLRALRPGVPQIACFDTEFHVWRPAVAKRYAIPHAWREAGVASYGFHGLSYEHIATTLASSEPDLANGRVLAAHLGNGASLCAMVDGRSLDTTMGFSPLDGLVMGTRCGSLDPGVILHMMEEKGLTARQVRSSLYLESGLLGVSGISSDMRILQASNAPRAAEAIELFVWRTVREIGALVSVMGGVDALVFTGGIGENDAAIRRAVGERLTWLGVRLDEDANLRGDRVINAADSRVAVRIIAADEERMIARHCQRLLRLN